MVSEWPRADEKMVDRKVDSEMGLIIAVTTAIRNIRSTWRIEAKRFIAACIKADDEAAKKVLTENQEFIKRLARIDRLEIEKDLAKPKASAASVCGDVEVFVPLKDIIDYDKEKARLTKSLEELQARFGQLAGKLKNKKFLQNAPADVVDKFKTSHQELKAQIDRLKANLDSLEQ